MRVLTGVVDGTQHLFWSAGSDSCVRRSFRKENAAYLTFSTEYLLGRDRKRIPKLIGIVKINRLAGASED